MKDKEKLNSDIKSLSENIGIPIIYLEQAIKDAQRAYNGSNANISAFNSELGNNSKEVSGLDNIPKYTRREHNGFTIHEVIYPPFDIDYPLTKTKQIKDE